MFVCTHSLLVVTHAGEGQDLESDSQRRKRIQREGLYDDLLCMWEQLAEEKKKAQAKAAKAKSLSKDLAAAGKCTMAAALGRVKRHRKQQIDNPDCSDDDGDDGGADSSGAKKRQRKRKQRNLNRKNKRMAGMLDPLTKVFKKQIKMQQKESRRDRLFQQQQACLGAKIDTLMLSILGKGQFSQQQLQQITDLTGASHFTVDSAESADSSSDSDF